jgi:tellurite resistance protein TehA-like permease
MSNFLADADPVSAIYLFRLFQNGLPDANFRPALFLAVGPPSFTIVALLKLADDIPRTYSYFGRHEAATDTIQAVALFFALFLWALAFWFFSLAVIATLMTMRQMTFHLTWFAFVFPNAGFTIATLSIGNQLECSPILWVGTAAAILIGAVWVTNNCFLLATICRGRLCPAGIG